MDFVKAHDIAKTVIKHGVKSVTPEQDEYAKRAYKALTGEDWKGCSSCWQKLYIQTDIINLQNKQTMSQRKFQLKQGKLIQMHGFPPITDANLTDELAVRLLKASRGHIKSFATYPANWEQLIDAYVETPIKPSPSLPKSNTHAHDNVDNNNNNNADDNDDGANDLDPIGGGGVANDDDDDNESNDADDDEKTEEQVRESLDVYSKKELQDICRGHEYDEAEWKKMNKEQLVNYIVSKQFPE